MEKNRTMVSIDGREYPVVSVESVEHIQEIAQMVDERVRSIRNRSVLNPQAALVFAALNLADELSKLKPEEEAAREPEIIGNRRREVRRITK